MLPVGKQHQSNVVWRHICLTITFAALIFMIKTIRHSRVACARALRLTTLVKRAVIRGFYKDACVIRLRCKRSAALWWKCRCAAYFWEVVMQTLSPKPVQQTRKRMITIRTPCSLFLFQEGLSLMEAPALHSSQAGQLCALPAVLKDKSKSLELRERSAQD